MSEGIAVYDTSGNLVWDTDGILARIIGVGVVTYAIFESGVKTIIIQGMTNSDEIIIYNILSDSPSVRVNISRSGDTVTFNKVAGSVAPAGSSHKVLALRVQ